MQDIGGCRAVVGSIRSLHKLIELYRHSIAKNPKGRSECIEEYAYLTNPKSDGYRGHHLVYKYRTKPGTDLAAYEGLRIEIQLRSRLQHAWATAVETVDTFTNQALKSGFGRPGWKQFFALMGSALATREHTTPVPETPTNARDLIEELRRKEKELNAITVLESLGVAVQHVSSREGLLEQVGAFLLELNVGTRTINVTGFPKATMEQAAEAYLESEKRASSDPAIQSVLVSVESLAQLQSAYPNYYLDTTEFVAAVRTAIQ